MAPLLLLFLLLRTVLSIAEPTSDETIVEPAAIKRVDMTRCFHEPEIFCYVGNRCLKEFQSEDHSSIERLNVTMLEDDPDAQMRVKNCDVAAIFEKPFDTTYSIDYKTNTNNMALSITFYAIDHKFYETIREIKIHQDKLECVAGCRWDKASMTLDEDPNIRFFSGTFLLDSGRADLKRCFEERDDFMVCFIGNDCLEDLEESHSSIKLLSQENITKFYNDETRRKMIEKCGVGATIDSTSTLDMYDINYHVDGGNEHLPLNFGHLSKKKQRLVIQEDKHLRCEPDCKFTIIFEFHVDRDLFWYGTVVLSDPNKTNGINSNGIGEKRANLSRCFDDQNMNCFTGGGCLNPDGGVHLEILRLTSNARISFKESSRRSAVELCDVGATFKRIFRQSNVFHFEYHTTSKYLDLVIDFEGREFSIVNGKIVCYPNCEFTENEEENRPSDELYWNGTISWVKKSRNLDNPDADPLAVGGSNEKEKNEKEKESPLGQTIIICGFVLGALFIIAIVIGIFIQRHLNAKNQRRREAIEKAVVAASVKASVSRAHSSTSDKSKKTTKATAEGCPLIEATQTYPDDEPHSEKTSTLFSSREN